MVGLQSLDLLHCFDMADIDKEEHERALEMTLEAVASDRLQHLRFSLKEEAHGLMETMMAIIKSLRKLHNLDMHVKVQDGIIKLLNQSLNKESNLKHLTITFIDPALATTELDGSIIYPSAADGGSKQP